MCKSLKFSYKEIEVGEKVRRCYSRGLEGVVVKETSISKIDGERGVLIYRGIDVRELVRHSCFEEVAFLIYKGYLPHRDEFEVFCRKLKALCFIDGKLIDLIRKMSDIEDYMDILKIAISFVGAFDGTEREIFDRALRVVAIMPVILCFAYRIKKGVEPVHPDESLSHAGNLYYMFTGRKPDREIEKVLDAALILHAEQGMNASTFSAVVISSTMTDIYSAVSGAVGSLKGYLHGGANRKVLDMFDEIGSVERVKEYVETAIREKRKIMGFGHRVYKTYDPRALVLKEFALKLDKRFHSRYLRIALELEKEVLERLSRKSIYPNVDFYSGIVYDMIGFPREVFTPLFAIARVVGWTAHIIEYRCKNRIFRPTSIYTGPVGLGYVPIDER